MDLEALYQKLPIPLQNGMCSLEGWRVRYTRYSGQFSTRLQEAEARTFFTPDQVREYRDQKLQAFVKHAVDTVAFYRDWFQQNNCTADDIQSLEDLKNLPILQKSDIQNQPSAFISEAIPQKQQIIAHTSGTTGGGLRFATTREAIQEQYAVWWRYRRWHGIKLNTWCAYFGGRSIVPLPQKAPPFWRYNLPGKQLLFSAYHMSPDNLGAYLKEIARKRLLWFHGYPSLLVLLAAYVIENNQPLNYPIRWITIGAETLLPQQEDLITRAFGVKPIQNYGMAEAVANFSECEYGALHVDEDFSAMEFIPNPDGSGYKIIGTNFTNPASPLIRYDTQDIATLSDTLCPCGRPGRVVEMIDGRKEDYITLKNGAKLGRLDHIFKDLVNIREAQIYQKKPGEIIIRLVAGDRYTQNDEEKLLQETQKRVGSDTDIIIQHMEKLERSSRGKLRFVISELPDSRISYPNELKS